MLDYALQYATKAHEGQFRWDNKTPYIEHPKAVVKLLKSFKVNDPIILSAGYLHDVIEDTNITYEILLRDFDKTIADLVLELTRESNEDYFKSCERMSKDASMIKICDILCNLTDIDSKKSMNFTYKRLKALSILYKNFNND